MDANTFVDNWVRQKEELVGFFCDAESETYVRRLIDELDLGPEQETQLRLVIDSALTDTMYGLLLGLTGAASIGKDQRIYKIFDDEQGEFIADPGDLDIAISDRFGAGE